MRNVRLIARLDIKGASLIKSVHLEGLRVIGAPSEFANRYYEQGADELIFMDCVASLYGRNHLGDILKSAVANIFVPLTVGGGIRSVTDASELLRCGADKVAVNTAAVSNPQLISDIAHRFGSQCMVLSIEARQIGLNRWEVLTDGGRERTGMDVVDWARRAESLGAGEILLTSVDREGTRKGFDLSLVNAVSESVEIPVIASGGMGSPDDAVSAVSMGGADAVAMADILHYKRFNIGQIREVVAAAGIGVREYAGP